MSTLSTSAPSKSFQTVLTVVPPSQSRLRTGVASRGRRSPASRSRVAAGGARAGGGGAGVCKGGGAVGEPLEVVHRQLPPPERLLTQGHDGLGPLGRREVGEVARRLAAAGRGQRHDAGRRRG